ncbi:hypothetical protein QFC20_006903 [Naganishia adeliensis]|uniref:Uncharacterized protein n=1 Tax=Naganishia adeliensis TaxID=92952 RepID=A0ACC2V5Z3_9TREE|nr:hypothetical protein QFC20_006903 [Naganishia adeliensis]
MTRINTPTSLPHPISAFLHAFYRASDTSPHTNPSANALYADFFTDDAPLLMGSQTFHGRQGVLSFREGGWEKVREREHVVLDVFARPDAREGEDTELMIRGTVEYGMKDGSAGHADWAGFMKLRWLEEEGGYKLAFYQVWILINQNTFALSLLYLLYHPSVSTPAQNPGCTNQQSLLPVSSVLTSLLTRARSQRQKTPFVQHQTLSDPTGRLVALAQGIELEVSLDNEDPSFGMGTGEPSTTPSTTGPGVRVDTLALAGQRMVIDVEIAHPSDGKGWRVVSLRVERVDPEHLATGAGGMDVDSPRLLSGASGVLQRSLGRYLDAVNAYDEAERRWRLSASSEEEGEGEGETLELKAERAVIAFGAELRDLRAIDLQMKPLDASEMDVDGASTEDKVLWDQLDELHAFIGSTPGLDIHEQTVLPTFRAFPRDTFLPNPLCRLVRSHTAPAAPCSTGSALAGWALEIDEPVAVMQGFFRTGSGDGKRSGEKTLEDLCGALRNALWINHLVKSCIRRDGAPEPTGNMDDELDELLAGTPVWNSGNLTVVVQPHQESLQISFPLSAGTRGEPRMLRLDVSPNGEGVRVSVSTESGEDGVGDLDSDDLARELVRLRGEVPVWLDGVWGKLYT